MSEATGAPWRHACPAQSTAVRQGQRSCQRPAAWPPCRVTPAHEPPRPRGHRPLPRVCGARALAVTAPSPVCVEHAPSRSPPPSPCAWRWVYGVTVHLTAVLARSVPVGRGPTPLSSQVFPLIFICAGVGTGIGHALKVKSNILDNIFNFSGMHMFNNVCHNFSNILSI